MKSGGRRIRAMTGDDLDAVSALEADAYQFPWTRGIFNDCLRVGYRCELLESKSGEFLGYCILATAMDEAHILNLCVVSNRRNEGLGGELLDHLLECARAAGCRRIFLEVRPSNLAALALYDGRGFEKLGVRRDYYRADDGREDAVVLAKSLRQSHSQSHSQSKS